MGRGTKHKRDWKPTTLQAAIDARRLYTHTVKIMANEKVFRPANDYCGETLKLIHRTVLDIYMKIWTANKVNARARPEQAAHRLALQETALEKCRELLALMELAKAQFHLPSRKFWNWAQMAYDLGLRLAAWHKSEKDKYEGKGASETASPSGGKVAVG